MGSDRVTTDMSLSEAQRICKEQDAFFKSLASDEFLRFGAGSVGKAGERGTLLLRVLRSALAAWKRFEEMPEECWKGHKNTKVVPK